ncbi:NTP transferase domain-containing protein [Glacieibacterium sp.]|uniref:NTP transferase domain-containing protein n=1 Tax=Glacieibacterium sp. TaxID=2860237 RepID=UPI003B004217
MIFATVDLDAAVGSLLGHGQMVGDTRWSKGRRLSLDDIDAARAAGLVALTVARLEAEDVPEADAAQALGDALAGLDIEALAPVHGRVNLAARQSGLLRLDAAAIDRINRIDESITLGTLAPFARVAAGEIVATVKIIPYAVSRPVLDLALAAVVPLSLAAFRGITVELFTTRLHGVSDKAVAKTESVTRARLASLGVTVGRIETCEHDEAALTALLAQPTSAAITLVAGASATVDRRDVVPAAIVAAGGIVERLGMPVDPGNLLCLGRIGKRPVIGLPGCARSPKRNGFDWVLERLVAGIDVTSLDVAAMGVGGLLPEAERPEPRVAQPAAAGRVGAIILAAGRSSRFGGGNKLLADLEGRPVVVHVADSLETAGLGPPLIVLGNMGAQVRDTLADRAAIYVEAADFAAGLSASLRAGLAAVPAEWRAVLVCLGDMPRVTPATMQALAEAATSDSAVAVPTWHGKRGNPVLWGRAHFPRLMAMTGDVGGKALLAELGDAVIEVEADSDGVLADVDTPEALAAMRDQSSGNSSSDGSPFSTARTVA